MPEGSDPFAPWADHADRLPDVLALPSFEEQVRALLDMNIHASAKQLAALPWTEPHVLAEFKALRSAWAAERSAKREAERERDEVPIEEALHKQFEDSVRARDMKGAKEAWALWGQISASKIARTTLGKDDDYARLTDHETLVLAALCHKLRDEPLTDLDVACLEYVSHLEVAP